MEELREQTYKLVKEYEDKGQMEMAKYILLTYLSIYNLRESIERWHKLKTKN